MWIEEAAVHRIGIRTSHQSQRGGVVRRHHARVARVELLRPSVTRQLARDVVDALGDDQHGTFGGLREEISQRAIEAAGENDALSVLYYEREGSVDLEHGARVVREQALGRVGFAEVPESLRLRPNQVDDAG